jgi:hypothetical protein
MLKFIKIIRKYRQQIVLGKGLPQRNGITGNGRDNQKEKELR